MLRISPARAFCGIVRVIMRPALLAPALLLVGTLSSVPWLVFSGDGLVRMVALQRELKAVRAENDRIRMGIADLKEEIRDLKEDAAAIERVARRELGLVRPDEYVFVMPKGELK
jgi:cell division protein FtsB